jgi:hypothetical protein
VVPFPGPTPAPAVGLGLKPAIGVIAASLLLGIVTGNFDYADPLIFGVSGEASATVDEIDAALIELGADPDLDEDEEPL